MIIFECYKQNTEAAAIILLRGVTNAACMFEYIETKIKFWD